MFARLYKNNVCFFFTTTEVHLAFFSVLTLKTLGYLNFSKKFLVEIGCILLSVSSVAKPQNIYLPEKNMLCH